MAAAATRHIITALACRRRWRKAFTSLAFRDRLTPSGVSRSAIRERMVEDRTTLLFPSQGSTSLPLCDSDGLVCCVAAGPGGHALRVLLDTGTDPSAIDSGLARRLAIHTGGQGIGSGAVSDEVPFTEAVLPWLRLGDLTIRDLYAPALELRTLPFDVDIVLGYNVLRQLALRIDYRRAMLTLAHPDLGAPQPEEHATVLPLVFFEQFPALEG